MCNDFIQSMQWRIDNKIDSVLEAGVDAALLEQFPYYVDGVDKKGRPGGFDLKNIQVH